jgi:hypothetical protein
MDIIFFRIHTEVCKLRTCSEITLLSLLSITVSYTAVNRRNSCFYRESNPGVQPIVSHYTESASPANYVFVYGVYVFTLLIKTVQWHVLSHCIEIDAFRMENRQTSRMATGRRSGATERTSEKNASSGNSSGVAGSGDMQARAFMALRFQTRSCNVNSPIINKGSLKSATSVEPHKRAWKRAIQTYHWESHLYCTVV